jgi:hypothetical protein
MHLDMGTTIKAIKKYNNRQSNNINSFDSYWSDKIYFKGLDG